MRQRLRSFFKWFLPILFIVYCGGITCSTHVHIEDGIMIVHAHPFKKSTDTGTHTHTSLEEIILFHTISSIQALDGAVHSLCLENSIQSITFLLRPATSLFETSWYAGNISLRAPPAIPV
ncbi:hypothetical protein LJC35_06385 [Parabacteroides sp. OttesenSCG-928-N08]|nr:hypothetical protein [Parabacteroides sp. OttesenSCG-928-N08]